MTNDEARELLDPQARLGNRVDRLSLERFPNGVSIRRQVAHGTMHVPLPQSVQSTVAIGRHVTLHRGQSDSRQLRSLLSLQSAMQRPQHQQLAADVRLRMRLPFFVDKPLFVLRQPNAKPSHRWPPCQNHTVNLDGDKKKSADLLKISLKTLYNRLNQYRGGP
jgi:hypothetical protein